MNKLILAAVAAAVALPGVASAQSYGQVHRDDHELRQDRRDLRDAQRYGSDHDVRQARRELQEDRRDRRDDWRSWRDQHPDQFRGPAYVGPRGYRYRPVAEGYQFAPSYYTQRYWIEPGRYHLPPAPSWQRYVRYGDDVVLVNRYGRVMRVFPGFFR